MRRTSCLAFAVAVIFNLVSSSAWPQDPTGVVAKDTRRETFEIDRLGLIHVLVPTIAIKSVAIFADGDGGWNEGVNDMAQLLANEGALVAGVDTPTYLHSLDTGEIACATPADDFTGLWAALKQRYSIAANLLPILVGYSSGATLIYAVLAQAPEKNFQGAMTLGFCDTLEIQRPLCKGRNLALHRSKEGLVLFPTRHLGASWFLLQGEIDQACAIKDVAEFIEPIAAAKLIGLPKVGHGFAVARRWQPQYVRAYLELAKTPNEASSQDQK